MMTSIQHELTEKDRLFFLHIPKTAGTTFRIILETKYSPQTICPAYYDAELAQMRDFSPYRLIRGHITYDQLRRSLPDLPVMITMLRDPVARFLSQYAYVNPNHSEYKFIKDLSFEEYVFSENPRLKTFMTNRHTQQLTDASGEVAVALERLKHFAFVGLTERFNDSLLLLCYIFGWFPIQRYQTHNVTDKEKKLDRATLSPEIYARVLELNALDQQIYEAGRQWFEEAFLAMSNHLITSYGEGEYQVSDVPLPQADLLKLLHRHHRARFQQAQRPQPRIDFAPIEGINGDGWHGVPLDKDGEDFRWTGPATEASHYFMVQAGQDYQLKVEIVRVVQRHIAQTLQVVVNDVAIPLEIEPKGQRRFECRGVIPREVVREGFLAVVIKTETTISPQELRPESNDKRKLGVAINRIQVWPV
jgi:hypothetical protein